VCLRIAEVGEYAVAEELREVSAKPLHHRRASLLVCTHDVAHFLRVDTCGELARADQITEHHRHLAPLAISRLRRGPRFRRDGRRSFRAQRCDGFAQADPVAERDAELLQVLLAKLDQGGDVDIVALEELGVLREAQGFKQPADIRHCAGMIRQHGRANPCRTTTLRRLPVSTGCTPRPRSSSSERAAARVHVLIHVGARLDCALGQPLRTAQPGQRLPWLRARDAPDYACRRPAALESFVCLSCSDSDP